MGSRRIDGILWTCDSCQKEEMAPNQTDVDEQLLAPKGWVTGGAKESTGVRDGSRSAEWVACKASCVGNAVKTMLAEEGWPEQNGDESSA